MIANEIKSASPPKSAIKNRFIVLDGMRGLAATVVMIYHAPIVFCLLVQFPRSALAVDFFFILSGFVVSYAYEERLRSKGITFTAYAIRRLIRLYPLIFVGAAVGGAYLLLTETDTLKTLLLFVPAALSFPVLFGNTLVPVNRFDPPEWSLFFEIFISLGYGAIASNLKYRTIIFLIAISGIILFGWSIWSKQTNLGFDKGTFWWGFPRVTFSFLVGVILQRLHKSGIGVSIRMPAWLSYALLGSIFYIPKFNSPIDPFIDMLIVSMVFPVLIMSGANQKHTWNNWTRAQEWIGDLSYPIYILHWPLFELALLLMRYMRVPYRNDLLGATIVSSMAVVLISTVVLKIYDEPIRRSLELWRRGVAIQGQS